MKIISVQFGDGADEPREVRVEVDDTKELGKLLDFVHGSQAAATRQAPPDQAGPDRVRELHEDGYSTSAIVRETGWTRSEIEKIIGDAHAPAPEAPAKAVDVETPATGLEAPPAKTVVRGEPSTYVKCPIEGCAMTFYSLRGLTAHLGLKQQYSSEVAKFFWMMGTLPEEPSGPQPKETGVAQPTRWLVTVGQEPEFWRPTTQPAGTWRWEALARTFLKNHPRPASPTSTKSAP